MNARFFYRSVDLINSVSKKIVVNDLIKKKDRILVSFSGGQDSIFLLFILNQLYSQMELNLALFWCHHLWQTDSFSLMQQIAKLSFLFQFNNCFAIPSKFISSELLARKWRYDCSYRVSSFYNYSKICLAHTSNDKVETLFLNLMRGTGLSGLSPLRWTQFVHKNNIENEEHISQIFSAQISPFFWCFLFDNKKRRQGGIIDVANRILFIVPPRGSVFDRIFLTDVWQKFWINDKKLKTVFLFSWESNIYNGTTNLTNLSFFSTFYLCLSPLCDKSPITFCCSSFRRGGTNFCFPKIYFYQDISSTASYFVDNMGNSKALGEQKNSILIIESEHFILLLKFLACGGPLFPCVLKKIVLKKHIRKLARRRTFEKISYKELSTKLIDTKKKKNKKAKRWFNCVSYTFFKACSTSL